MKLNRFSHLYMFAFFLPCLTGAVIDAEFVPMHSAALLKGRATYYKALPLLAHHRQVMVGTDIDYLTKAISDGNNSAYIAFAKKGLKTLIEPWIDSLQNPADVNNKFVVGAVATASLGKADRTRQSFKEALIELINAFNPVAGVPINGTFKNLKATKNAINQEFADKVNTWIDTLSMANLLNKAVYMPAPEKPLSQSAADFKTAIEALIKTF